MIKSCRRCNKEFTTYPSRIKLGQGNFCSISCSLFGEKRHSVPHTEEAKIKIGNNTPKYSGSKHWNWKGGIHKDKEHRARLHYIRTRRRLIRKMGNRGTHTLEEWEYLKNKYNHTCPCCNERNKLTEDHIIPLSKNGLNNIKNIQPLCRKCNSKKGVNIIKFEYATN